jgi:PKD repeat protein
MNPDNRRKYQGKMWRNEASLQKMVSFSILIGLICGGCIQPVIASEAFTHVLNPFNEPPGYGLIGTISDQWNKEIYKDDWANSVVPTSDGGFAVTGCTKSGGAGALYIKKFDNWGHRVGASWWGGRLQDEGYCIRQTRNGDFIVAGVWRYWGDRDVDIDWGGVAASTAIGYIGGLPGAGALIYLTFDVLSDLFSEDKCTKFYVLRVDKELHYLAQNWYSWKGADMAFCIQETSDGGIIAVGTQGTSSAGANVLLIKYDAELHQIWKREYPAEPHRGKDDVGRWVEQTSDGGVIITGFTKSYLSKNNFDILLVKTNDAGYEEWSRPILGDVLTKDDVGNCVKQTPDGGFIIVGTTKSFSDGKHTDIMLVKVTGDGHFEWYKVYDGGGEDSGSSLCLTPDGGFIILGNRQSERGDSDIWVIKTNENGEKIWEKIIGNEYSEAANSIEPTSDGRYVIAGVVAIPTGEYREVCPAGCNEYDYDNPACTCEKIPIYQKDSYMVVLDTEPVASLRIRQVISKDGINTYEWVDVANRNTLTYLVSLENWGNYPLSNIEVIENGTLITTIPELGLGNWEVISYQRFAEEGDHQSTVTVNAWYDPGYLPLTAQASAGYHSSQVFVPNFTASPVTGIAPLTVQFNDTTIGTPTTWEWHFGDNGVSYERNPSHTYYRDGMYRVSLTVGNEVGYASVAKDNFISVRQGFARRPVANFTSNITSGYAPFTTGFTDTSTGTHSACVWSFGDGSGAITPNPIHTFTDPGTYNVSLTISGRLGSDSETKKSYITVTLPLVQPPVANFAATPTSGHTPLNVTFIDKSTGSPELWYWQFGDGTGSSLQNPVHLYTNEGDYTVSLSVSNSEGNDTEVKTNYVHANYPANNLPDADFSATSRSGPAPLSVHFTDLTSGSPTTWLWRFGDDWYSELQNPEHSYTKPGNYSVSLLAWNKTGFDTVVKTAYIHVTPGESPPVSADFTATPTSGTSPLEVRFSSASPGTPVSWQWAFGDGTDSAEAAPVHTYTESGYYSVGLVMTTSDDESVVVTKSRYISVSEYTDPPHADFTANPTSGLEPLTVTFVDLSTGGPANWSWEFGDGAVATGKNPVHIYRVPGNYTVNLTVANSAGQDRLTKPAYIMVRARPAGEDGITLAPGWNLISVPVRLENGADTAMLFEGVNTASHTIWTFDGSQRKWVAMGASSPVRPLHGIWIYSTDTAFVPLYYSQDPLQAPPVLSLAKGWNCVGIGGFIPCSARDVFLSAGDDWTQAIGYDATSRQFENAVVNGGQGAFADTRILYPFRGYWLYASGECELASLGV